MLFLFSLLKYSHRFIKLWLTTVRITHHCFSHEHEPSTAGVDITFLCGFGKTEGWVNDDGFIKIFRWTIPLHIYNSPVHTHYVLHSNMFFLPVHKHKLTLPDKHTPCNWPWTTAGYCFHLSTNFQCCQLNKAGKNGVLREKIERESEK